MENVKAKTVITRAMELDTGERVFKLYNRYHLNLIELGRRRRRLYSIKLSNIQRSKDYYLRIA